ncbi:MAG: zinc ABC transporter substrate-binding protein, partial [Clostridiaceae bacterium]
MEIKYLKSKVVAFAIILGLLAVSGCTIVNSETTDSSHITGSNSSSSTPEVKSLKILTTTRMLKDIVTYYTQDYHVVEAMVNSDRTLKSFTPYYSSYKDKNYDTFLYQGAGYEPFLDGFLADVNRNTIDVVNLSRGIDILRFKENNLDKENPYYLNNSTNYKIILSSIKNNLQELDIARRKEYEAKFEDISVKIDELQKKIKA